VRAEEFTVPLGWVAVPLTGNKARPPRRRSLGGHIVLTSVGFALTLLLGDGILSGVEMPHVSGSTNECRWKWDLYQGREATPEVAFIGDSYFYYGISPTVVDAEFERLTGQPLRSLNLASPASSALTQLLLVRRMLAREDRPRVVYLGVSPVSLDAARVEDLESGIRALAGFRELPLVAASEPALLREAVLASVFSSYHRWRDSRLIAERAMAGAPIRFAYPVELDECGWAKWQGGPIVRIERSGHEESIAPPRSLGEFIGTSANARALYQVVGLLRSAGISTRLLELPSSTTASLADNPETNMPYRALVARIADDLKIRVIRPPKDLVTDDDFWDGRHLSESGAVKLSRWLAGDVAAELPPRRDQDSLPA
jgi:hypothetical protein